MGRMEKSISHAGAIRRWFALLTKHGVYSQSLPVKPFKTRKYRSALPHRRAGSAPKYRH
jgi:hypothetical protein